MKREMPKRLIGVVVAAFFMLTAHAGNLNDTTTVSTKRQALEYLKRIKNLKSSIFWPNIEPKAFLKNVELNVDSPLVVYEGSNTNFCGYAALTYLPLNIDPLGYAKFMITIFNDGSATYGKAFINPSPAIHTTAGTLKFKGILDVHPADQLWFLSLADHFKGYLNIFKRHYKPGFENTFWASVNYAKFNRMVRTLFNLNVHARGSDLMHPAINNLFDYITSSMHSGVTFLYLNNAFLYRRKHILLRPGIPTHYVVLLELQKEGDQLTMIYWDYGFRSLRQMTPAFLKKIVFGISHCTKKINDPVLHQQ